MPQNKKERYDREFWRKNKLTEAMEISLHRQFSQDYTCPLLS